MTSRREMQRADFEAAADELYKIVCEGLALARSITPVMFAIRLDENHKIETMIPIDCSVMFTEKAGIAGKNLAAGMLERLASTPETDIAALVSEAWVLDAGKAEQPPADRDLVRELADDPRRKDAVSIFLRTEHFATVAWYLFDESTQTLIYQPLKWDIEGVTGRFAHRRQHSPLN